MIDLYLKFNNKASNTKHIQDEIISFNDKKYIVGERINNGGNCVVHKCTDIYENGYAVKFLLKSDEATNEQKIQRFLIETEVLKEIEHHAIIRYIDSGETENIKKSYKIPFVVMELADKDLLQYLEENEFLTSFEDYVGQFLNLASGLSYIHKKGIHRDIKPENILVIGDRWVISDFGLFKAQVNSRDLTTQGELVNPKFWMSPEGINSVYRPNGAVVCKSSDVFQLGCIFWLVVNGKYPLGVVNRTDWKGDHKLFKPILKCILHELDKRIIDGDDLYSKLKNALVA